MLPLLSLAFKPTLVCLSGQMLVLAVRIEDAGVTSTCVRVDRPNKGQVVEKELTIIQIT